MRSSVDHARSASNAGVSTPRPATSLSQRFSNATEPSISSFAANGEFHQSSESLPHEDSRSCAAQMAVDSDTHGVTDPISFEFDLSTGYLPITEEASQSLPSGGLQGVSPPETGCSTLAAFLQLVSSERLNRMPHRASKWDQMIRLLEGIKFSLRTISLRR